MIEPVSFFGALYHVHSFLSFCSKVMKTNLAPSLILSSTKLFSLSSSLKVFSLWIIYPFLSSSGPKNASWIFLMGSDILTLKVVISSYKSYLDEIVLIWTLMKRDRHLLSTSSSSSCPPIFTLYFLVSSSNSLIWTYLFRESDLQYTIESISY